MQFPPEAWLRMSLHNSSITWVAIRPSGRVVLRALGDCGHIPPDKLTTTWSLDSTKTSGFDQSPPDIQLETKLFSSIGNKYKLFPTMRYVYSTQICLYTNYYNTRTYRGLSLQQIFAFFFHFFRMASLSWTLVPWSFSIFHVCRLYCWHKLISQIETASTYVWTDWEFDRRIVFLLISLLKECRTRHSSCCYWRAGVCFWPLVITRIAKKCR